MPRSRKKTFLFIFFYILFLVLFCEFSIRAVLGFGYHTSFFDPSEIIYSYYRNIIRIKHTDIQKNDNKFDVLLLGGSAFDKEWGNIEKELYKQFKEQSKSRIMVHNASFIAHSTLDSRIKMNLLRDKAFDLVILYHGINEVRANNCPDHVFKKDYSHYAFYEEINNILKHKEMKYFTMPFLINYLFIKIKQKILPGHYVPQNLPKKEWLDYGKNVKTGESFRENVLSIVETARQGEIPILLLTFAYYVPDDYSNEIFRNEARIKGKKDEFVPVKLNGLYVCPIELWGKPEYVQKGIGVHNRITRSIALENKYQKLYFFDMERKIKKSSEIFRDICHFTPQGSSEFVAQIMPLIIQISNQ